MLGLHWRTIFSFSVYHRLAFATKWQAAWFVVYLFLICLVGLNLFVGRYLDAQMPLMIKNFPLVAFENGRLVQPAAPTLFEIPASGFSILFKPLEFFFSGFNRFYNALSVSYQKHVSKVVHQIIGSVRQSCFSTLRRKCFVRRSSPHC